MNPSDTADSAPPSAHAVRSSDLQRSLLAAIGDVVLLLALDGTILDFNPAAVAQMNVRERGVRLWIDLWPEGDRPAARRAMEVAREGRTGRLAVATESPRGARTWWDVRITPVCDPAGEICELLAIARDVTETAGAEAAMRHITESLGLALRGGRMGWWSRDIATNEVLWSHELEEIFGLSPGQFEGTEAAFFALVHEEDRSAVAAEVERAILEHRDYIIEFRFLHADGSVRWMEGRGRATYGDDGTPTHLYGIGIDVTERRRNEQSLLESQERFRAMADLSPTIIWTADPSGRITHHNSQWLQFTGLTPEQNEADWAARVLHPDDYERCVAEWTRCLSNGDEYEIEVRNRRRDGEYRWFLTRAVPLRDEEGRIMEWFGTTTDIHDRKLAEEALRESDWRKAAILESALDAIVTMGADGRIVEFNPAAELIFGYSRDEAVGRTVAELLVPERLRGAHVAGLARFLETGVSGLVGNRVELSALRKGGAEFPVELTMSVVDRPGLEPFFTAYIRDLTDRRQAERALADLAARLQAVVQTAVDGILTIDETGIIETANPAVERIFGYEERELIGNNVSMLMPEPYHGEHDGYLARYHETGERRIIGIGREVRGRRKDGSEFPLDLSVSETILDGRRFYTGLVRDATERYAANEALRASEERFRVAAAAVGGIVYDWDLRTGVLTRSDGCHRVFGFHPDETDATNDWWLERVHPDDRDRIPDVFDRQASDGAEFEYRARHRDGRWLFLVDRERVLRDDSGNPVRVIGYTQDVTAEREAQLALEEADRRKDEFLATLAHELRNPLAPIRNSVSLLEAIESADPRLDSVRAVVDRQVRQMTRLLDDLLDVSRITRSRLELRKEIVELDRILDAALEASGPHIVSAGHRVVRSEPAEPIWVPADAARLTQVFQNLLNNAAKYMDPGGVIEIEVNREGAKASVCVRDHGIGIAPRFLPRIFEMFAQENESISRAQGGLGIGLSLAKGIVELHGGTIEVRSDGAGSGSEFTVRLPACEASPSDLSSSGGRSDLPRIERRILVVDDLKDSADSWALLLEMVGATVEKGYDGFEAVEVAERFRPEIAILDIGLPGLDGYEVAKRIRAQPWGANVKLVALTGWGQDEDRRRTQEAGFDVHLVKPFQFEDLVRLLVGLL